MVSLSNHALVFVGIRSEMRRGPGGEANAAQRPIPCPAAPRSTGATCARPRLADEARRSGVVAPKVLCGSGPRQPRANRKATAARTAPKEAGSANRGPTHGKAGCRPGRRTRGDVREGERANDREALVARTRTACLRRLRGESRENVARRDPAWVGGVGEVRGRRGRPVDRIRRECTSLLCPACPGPPGMHLLLQQSMAFFRRIVALFRLPGTGSPAGEGPRRTSASEPGPADRRDGILDRHR